MYAIVDIETTGGYAAAGGITEIAVYIFDGKEIVTRFQTLLNPVHNIPRYVESLTGITNAMVENERHFSAIADELYELLHDKIFVAHNVNFDYSFIKYHLAKSGYILECRKLCTVRLARQIIPGMPSYSLGKICRHLQIEILERHRAGGDAEATVKLFSHLLSKDTNGYLQSSLSQKSKEQHLPPNLASSQVKALPQLPGVYYFHDQKGKVIYVGKAKSLAKRVSSHFTNNKPGRQKQEFLRKIHSISYKVCGTELMAFILENVEIRKHWPDQNRSQKRFEQSYALYSYVDQNKYMRLAIEKKNRNLGALYTFNLLTEGHNLLRKLVVQFKLCPKLCFLQSGQETCQGIIDQSCGGACTLNEPAAEYNNKVEKSLKYLQSELPTFALFDNGIQITEQSCILMEKGRFYGMGYLPSNVTGNSIEELKTYITPYSENDYIRGLVYNHADRYPNKKVEFKYILPLN